MLPRTFKIVQSGHTVRQPVLKKFHFWLKKRTKCVLKLKCEIQWVLLRQMFSNAMALFLARLNAWEKERESEIVKPSICERKNSGWNKSRPQKKGFLIKACEPATPYIQPSQPLKNCPKHVPKQYKICPKTVGNIL